MKLPFTFAVLFISLFCISQPEYTRKQKVSLQSSDQNLSLHCRKGYYIISFDPSDLTNGYSNEKKTALESFLHRSDTMQLDSLVEQAALIVRDSTFYTRFSGMVCKTFLNGHVAIHNLTEGCFIPKMYALVDDRMSWLFITYYYFTDLHKSTLFFQFNDVSFGCPAF